MLKDACIVNAFLCLSKIGLRNCLIRLFAFFPPRLPTYTLRDPLMVELEKVYPKPSLDLIV
jgi:hypothetical protein